MIVSVLSSRASSLYTDVHDGKGVLMIVEWSHRILISFRFLEGLSVFAFLLIAVDC